MNYREEFGLITSPSYVENLIKLGEKLKSVRFNVEISANLLGEDKNRNPIEWDYIEKYILSGELRKKTENFADLGISSVILKENVNILSEIIEEIYRKSGINYFSLGTIEEGTKKNLAIDAGTLERLITQFQKLAKKYPIQISLTIYHNSVKNFEKLVKGALNPSLLKFPKGKYFLPFIPVEDNFLIIPKVGVFSIAHIVRFTSYGLAYFSTHPFVKFTVPYVVLSKWKTFLDFLYDGNPLEFYRFWKEALQTFESCELKYPFCSI